MNKAEFIPRFAAWFIDILVITAIAIVLTFVAGLAVGLLASMDSSFLGLLASTLGIFLLAVLFLLQFFYFGYFWSRNGQSVGKKTLNIKVVDKDSGQSLSFLNGGLRGSIGYWISAVIFWLGYIWAAIDAEDEAWHDKIFGTAVVKTPEASDSSEAAISRPSN